LENAIVLLSKNRCDANYYDNVDDEETAIV
jgi:hypothetical protein